VDRGRADAEPGGRFISCATDAVFVLVYLTPSFVLDPDELAERLRATEELFRQVEPGEATRCISRCAVADDAGRCELFAAFCLTWPWCKLAESTFLSGRTSLLILVGTVLDAGNRRSEKLVNTSLGG